MRPITPVGLLAIAFLLAGSSSPAVAQDSGARLGVSPLGTARQGHEGGPSRKDPGTATLISALVIGGGQMYAGDTTRGLLMLAAPILPSSEGRCFPLAVGATTAPPLSPAGMPTIRRSMSVGLPQWALPSSAFSTPARRLGA